MTQSKVNPGAWLRRCGLLLIAAALFLTVYNLWDQRRAGQQAADITEQLVPQEVAAAQENEDFGALPAFKIDPDRDLPISHVDGRDYVGTIEIPGFSLPVLNEWSYPNLKIAPCRYVGTPYKKNFVICAHNYMTHFGTLKNLIPGDRIRFIDVDGNIFDYEVIQTETLQKMDSERMKTGDWDLTLFTCTVGGRTRVTVRCREIEETLVEG